jgi:hypothetical protein
MPSVMTNGGIFSTTMPTPLMAPSRAPMSSGMTMPRNRLLLSPPMMRAPTIAPNVATVPTDRSMPVLPDRMTIV